MQSELNKNLFEAIKNTHVYPGENLQQAIASACEKIVLQEKIDLLNLLGYQYVDADIDFIIQKFKRELTEQLNK